LGKKLLLVVFTYLSATTTANNDQHIDLIAIAADCIPFVPIALLVMF
jgi:hypothetical protein